MNNWKQQHDAFWGALSHQKIQEIIDQDPTDIRSTNCAHVKYSFCPDCNYTKKKGK